MVVLGDICEATKDNVTGMKDKEDPLKYFRVAEVSLRLLDVSLFWRGMAAATEEVEDKLLSSSALFGLTKFLFVFEQKVEQSA